MDYDQIDKELAAITKKLKAVNNTLLLYDSEITRGTSAQIEAAHRQRLERLEYQLAAQVELYEAAIAHEQRLLDAVLARREHPEADVNRLQAERASLEGQRRLLVLTSEAKRLSDRLAKTGRKKGR